MAFGYWPGTRKGSLPGTKQEVSPRTAQRPSSAAPLPVPAADTEAVAGPSSPHTPTQSARSAQPHPALLSPFDTAGSTHSRAPLVRDYAAEERARAGGSGERARADSGSASGDTHFALLSHTSLDRPQPPPPPVRADTDVAAAAAGAAEPALVPPPSRHDAYVARFLGAGGAGAAERAPLIRSSSAPGVPQPGAVSPLAPVAGAAPGVAAPAAAPSGALLPSALDDAKPIFAIFDAELDDDAAGLVDKLRSHLEAVLSVQEEVGRMHLGLEGLGAGGAGGACGAAGAGGGDAAVGASDGPNHGAAASPGSAGGHARVPSGGADGDGHKRQGSDHSKQASAGRAVFGADELERRERGVEAIMSRLSALSSSLKTYHALGTPALSFPAHAARGARSAARARTASVDPAHLVATPGSRSPAPGPPAADVPVAVDRLRAGLAGLAGPASAGERESDPFGDAHERLASPASPASPRPGPSRASRPHGHGGHGGHGMLGDLARVRASPDGKRTEAWVEHGEHGDHSEHGAVRVESPAEMAHSRPW